MPEKGWCIDAWFRGSSLGIVHHPIAGQFMAQRKHKPGKTRRQTGARTFSRATKRGRSDIRARALQVKADMLRNPLLTRTEAARNRRIDPRTIDKEIPSAFYKDSSGRIKARVSESLSSDTFHSGHKTGRADSGPDQALPRTAASRPLDGCTQCGRA